MSIEIIDIIKAFLKSEEGKALIAEAVNEVAANQERIGA